MATIRFSGMASGMDTEKIVKDLVKSQSGPMNRLLKSKQTLEWKRDAYRDMNTLLMDLRSAADSLRFAGNFNKKVATSENDNIVTATSTGSPKLSNYVVEVKKLARAEMPAGLSLKLNPEIKDLNSVIGGSDFTLDVNGTSVQVKANETLEHTLQKLNSVSGVTAQFTSGAIILNSTSIGTLNGDTGTTFKVTTTFGSGSRLGITGDMESSERKAGQKAQVMINGVLMKSDTNKISFDGTEFNLKSVNKDAPIQVSMKVDKDAVVKQVTDFVNKYNDTIAKINAKLSEPKYKGYEPLLEEEVEALPEKTAEKMENMAKSGLLLRDPLLKQGLDDLRGLIAMPLIGAAAPYNTLSGIGIGGPPSGKNAYMENGKLYLDETKLKAALDSDPDAVTKLFSNYSSASDQSQKTAESGIAQRLYSKLNDVINKLSKEAGSSTTIYDDSNLSKKITSTDDEIEVWKDRLKQIEDRYYKQFTTMETAMSKAQSQGNWFAQMLAK